MMVAPRAVPVKVLAFASMSLRACARSSETLPTCVPVSVFAAARISDALSARSFCDTTGAMMMVAWSDAGDAFGAGRPSASWAQS